MTSSSTCLEVPLVFPHVAAAAASNTSPVWQADPATGVWHPTDNNHHRDPDTGMLVLLSEEESQTGASIARVSSTVTVTTNLISPSLLCVSRLTTDGPAPCTALFVLPTGMTTTTPTTTTTTPTTTPSSPIILTTLHVLSNKNNGNNNNENSTQVRVTITTADGWIWFWTVDVNMMTTDGKINTNHHHHHHHHHQCALTPKDALRGVHVRTMLPTTPTQQQHHHEDRGTGTTTIASNATHSIWLRRSAITWLNASTVLLAVAPYLVSIDVLACGTNPVTAAAAATDTSTKKTTTTAAATTAATLWSASWTAERQASSSSSLWYGSLMNYLVGPAPALQDMAPILTLTSATTTATTNTTTNTNTNTNTNDDDVVWVYSWHDDGILRQWLWKGTDSSTPAGNNPPHRVTEFNLCTEDNTISSNINNNVLPDVTLQGVRLCATVSNTSWTLAMASETTLHLIQGGTVTINAALSSQDLVVVPRNRPGTATLIDWQWTASNTLQTLWCSYNNSPNATSNNSNNNSMTPPPPPSSLSREGDEILMQCTYDTTSETIDPVHVMTQGWQQSRPLSGYHHTQKNKYQQQQEDALDWMDETDVPTWSSPEESLHWIDQRYLQYLLRPRRVRGGTGTVLPPSSTVLRHALHQVTGQAITTKTTSEKHHTDGSPSVGVQIVLALHRYRQDQQDQRNSRRYPTTTATPHRPYHPHHILDKNTAPKTPKQLYEALQRQAMEKAAQTKTQLEATTPTAAPVVAAAPSTVLLSPQEQVQEHQSLWKRFLKCVWKLERETHRAVLAVQWTANPAGNQYQDQAVVVRAGVISVLTTSQPQPVVNGVQGLLDNTAIRLLAALDDTCPEAMWTLEHAVEMDLLSSEMALHPTDCLDALQASLDNLGDNPLWNERVLKPADANQLVQGFQAADVMTLIQDLQTLPVGYGMAGLNVLPADSCRETPTTDYTYTTHDLENVHWRLSTLSLTMMCLDSHRRLQLGRYMVLKYLGVRREVCQAALWGYLQSLSLLLTAAQHVQVPLTGAPTQPTLHLRDDTDSTKFPPKKRPSLDNFVPTLFEHDLGAHGKTTALDALCIRISRGNFASNTPPSLLAWPILVSKALFRTLILPLRLSDATNLPELALLRSSPTQDAAKYPRFALWLLSPAFAIREDAQEQRRSALAQCLLSLAKDERSQAHSTALAERAFELMKFNPHEMEQGVERINKLHTFVGTGSRFMDHVLHVVQRAVTECTNYYTDDIWSRDEYMTLLALYFSAAKEARQWKTATEAAIMLPDPKARSDRLKRLVRHMVDNGALADLVQVCALEEDEMSDARLQGIDLYAVAMDCLGSVPPSDAYLQSLTAQEPISDYQGALFALHVTNNQWKRAAHAMDARYINARNALLQNSDKPTAEEARDRERLAVQDLALSATGRATAIGRIDDRSGAFLVSGEPENWPTLPLHLMTIRPPDNPAKRSRGQQGDSADTAEELTRLERFMIDVDFELSSVRAFCFQILHAAGKVGAEEARVFFKEPYSLKSDQTLITELFKHGYYQYGLLMGKALRDTRMGKVGGIDALHDVVYHLSSAFLIPLMLGKETFQKPDIQQMYASLDAISSGNLPCLPPLSKSLQGDDASSHCIRQLAGEILRHVTTTYTTAATPVAKEVVECLLTEYGPAPLPEWLHNLMVFGTPSATSSSDLSGLFAKRPGRASKDYLGDPSILLTKYTHAGMFEEACRVIKETLAVHEQSATAAQRLPEKGDMDWVPYHKIDLLYNLIDVSMERGLCDGDQLERLRRAQKELKSNVERHLELLSISEMGLSSARALHT